MLGLETMGNKNMWRHERKENILTNVFYLSLGNVAEPKVIPDSGAVCRKEEIK